MSSQVPEFRSTFEASNVTFCDERHRAGVLPMGCHADAVASVTLTSADGDTSWGEFFDREGLEGLRAWIDTVLAPQAGTIDPGRWVRHHGTWCLPEGQFSTDPYDDDDIVGYQLTHLGEGKDRPDGGWLMLTLTGQAGWITPEDMESGARIMRHEEGRPPAAPRPLTHTYGPVSPPALRPDGLAKFGHYLAMGGA